MPRNRYVKWGAILALLVLANIVNYLYWNWGLVTVKVKDAPLSQVIKSIEWQGWVTIYTNLPGDSKVSMWVDHVSLAEAMETLANTVDVSPTDLDRPDRPDRLGPPGSTNAPGIPSTTAPPSAGAVAAGAPPAPGTPDAGNHTWERRAGSAHGEGCNGIWPFFVAPTSSAVKAEIRAFQEGTVDDDARGLLIIPPHLQMVVTEDDLRRRRSTGSIVEAAINRLHPSPLRFPIRQRQTGGWSIQLLLAARLAPAPPPPPTVHYLPEGLCQGSEHLDHGSDYMGSAGFRSAAGQLLHYQRGKKSGGPHGWICHAGVCPAGGLGAAWRQLTITLTDLTNGDMNNLEAMGDRIRNAIDGLPEDARADALNQLDQEIKFFKDVRNAPEDQQMQMVSSHIQDKLDRIPIAHNG